MKYRKFPPEERGRLAYTLWHWLAFQTTAMRCHVWKPRFLFHDSLKPLAMIWFGGDYEKVQRWHRTHSRHHLEYEGRRPKDYLGMVIDWECARLTKAAKPMDALQKFKSIQDSISAQEQASISDALIEAHLAWPQYYFNMETMEMETVLEHPSHII